MTEAAGRALPKRPAKMSTEELRPFALLSARRLRKRDPAEPLGASAQEWLAELLATLANRLPFPKVARGPVRRR